MSFFRCGLKTEEPSVASWTKQRKTKENSKKNLHQGQFLLHQKSTNQKNQVLRHTSSQAAVRTWTGTCGTIHRQYHWRTVKITPLLPYWQTIPAQCLCLPHTLPLRRDPHPIIDKPLTVLICHRRICTWIDRASNRILRHICNERAVKVKLCISGQIDKDRLREISWPCRVQGEDCPSAGFSEDVRLSRTRMDLAKVLSICWVAFKRKEFFFNFRPEKTVYKNNEHHLLKDAKWEL